MPSEKLLRRDCTGASPGGDRAFPLSGPPLSAVRGTSRYRRGGEPLLISTLFPFFLSHPLKSPVRSC